MTKRQKLLTVGAALGACALLVALYRDQKPLGTRVRVSTSVSESAGAQVTGTPASRGHQALPAGPTAAPTPPAVPGQSPFLAEFLTRRELALGEWRARVRPLLDGCLPTASASSPSHPVQIILEWQGELSGPTLQRFAVTSVVPFGDQEYGPEIATCLDRLRGTTVNIEASEDVLVAGETRLTDFMDLRWSTGA